MKQKTIRTTHTSNSAQLPGCRIGEPMLPALVQRRVASRQLTRFHILLVTLLAAALPGSVFAAPMSVAVLPPNPSLADNIDLETKLSWATAGFSVMGSAVAFTSAFEFEIAISVNSPEEGTEVAQIITDELHLTNLGLLPAGEYSYTVFEFDFPGGSDPSVPAGSLAGTFTVVPEPSSLALALFGLSGLMIGRRGKKAA